MIGVARQCMPIAPLNTVHYLDESRRYSVAGLFACM